MSDFFVEFVQTLMIVEITTVKMERHVLTTSMAIIVPVRLVISVFTVKQVTI